MKGIAERNGYRSPTTTPAFQTELLARSCYGGCANRRNATAPRYWRTALRRSTARPMPLKRKGRSEEHTSELQSLMRISYAVFCLKKKKHSPTTNYHPMKPNSTNRYT